MNKRRTASNYRDMLAAFNRALLRAGKRAQANAIWQRKVAFIRQLQALGVEPAGL